MTRFDADAPPPHPSSFFQTWELIRTIRRTTLEVRSASFNISLTILTLSFELIPLLLLPFRSPSIADIFMYQETVQLVLDWIDALPAKERARTVMLSTSDHETGGLTLARQLDPSIYPTYAYYPSALENVTRSTIFLGEHILTRAESRGGEDVEESWVKEQIFGKGLGIEDGTDEELERVRAVQGDAVKLDNVWVDSRSKVE